MEDKIEATSSLQQRNPSLLTNDDKVQDEELENGVHSVEKGEQVFIIPNDRKLGFISVLFLIVNTMIGTGIFSTPANVYRGVNSVGPAMILWSVGAILTICRYQSLFPMELNVV